MQDGDIDDEDINTGGSRMHASRDSRPDSTLFCKLKNELDAFDASLQGHRSEPSFIAETSFVKAPLNSRVTSHSASTKGKGKAREDTSLSHVPIEVQEAMILEDLLFVLSVSATSSGLAFFLIELIAHRASKEHISPFILITLHQMISRSRASDSSPHPH